MYECVYHQIFIPCCINTKKINNSNEGICPIQDNLFKSLSRKWRIPSTHYKDRKFQNWKYEWNIIMNGMNISRFKHCKGIHLLEIEHQKNHLQ